MVGANEEETEAPTDDAAASAPQKKGERQSFRGLRRNLSEDELRTPAVQKMLLDEVERLDDEIKVYKQVQDLFHERDKELGILKNKLGAARSNLLIVSATEILGSIMIGFSLATFQFNISTILILVVGVALVIISVIARSLKQ